jgi:hypothetical protein
MYNIKSKKYPAYPTSPTHRVLESSIFLESDDDLTSNPPSRNTPLTPFSINQSLPNPILNTNRVVVGNNVILLEHSLGYNAEWSRVKLFNSDNSTSIGYVKTQNLIPITILNPLLEANIDNSLAADLIAPSITWKDVTPLTVFDDRRNGTYAVNVELTEVTEFNSNTGDSSLVFNKHLEDAFNKGARIILEDQGYDTSNDKLVNELLNKYYQFFRVEEWYIDPRPCSPLRVLVAIQKRLLFSNAWKLPLKSSLFTNKDIFNGKLSSFRGPSTTTTVEYQDVIFNTKQEYDSFFDELIKTLSSYDVPLTSRKWSFTPQGYTVNLKNEASDIKKLRTKIDSLILTNIPQLIKKVYGFEDVRFNEFFTNPTYYTWEGKLKFTINKTDLKIVKVYFNNLESDIVFTKGIFTFLNQIETKNKTYVYYLLNFSSERNAVKGREFFSAWELEQAIQKFFKDEHYPSLAAVAEPIDIVNCISDNIDLIGSIYTDKVDSVEQLLDIKREEKESNLALEQSDLFIKSILDLKNVVDPNFRILFGIDEPPGNNTKEKVFNYLKTLKAVDWMKFLAFASQCMAVNISPEDYANISKNYQNARKFIENLLLTTLCNPFLGNALKTINGISFPRITTNNSMETLVIAVEQAIAKMLMDVLIEGVKNALKKAAEACISDPNANFGGAGDADFDNPLDDSFDDPNLSDLLDDLFGDINAPDGSGLLDDNDKALAKEKLVGLLDDIAACLSTTEFCRILKGYSVNSEVMIVISALAKKRFGDTIINKFEDPNYIYNFFKKLGSRIDLSVCQDFLNDERPRSANVLCDDGRIQQLRKNILENKGLPEDAINDLLEDIKKKEKDNLEKVFEILNSENPFDFSKVPDLACQVFPNGETIAPPSDSFNKTVDALFKTVYDNFNSEAANWYTTTYSISSPNSSLLTFDESGKITVKKVEDSAENKARMENIYNLFESSPDKRKQVNSLDSAASNTSQGTYYPSYAFQKAIKENKIKYNFVNDNNTVSNDFDIQLNGYDQQALDLTIITNDMRDAVLSEEQKLRKQVSRILTLLNLKFIYEIVESTIDLNLNEGAKKWTTLAGDVITIIRGFDLFFNNNIVDGRDPTRNRYEFYEILGLKDSQEAAALYSLDKGVPLYLVVADTLFNPDGTIKRSAIDLVTFATSINKEFNVSSNDEERNNILADLSARGQQYAKIKSSYTSILNATVKYPNYDIKVKTGLNELKIPLNKKIVSGDVVVTIGEKDAPSYTFNTFDGKDLYDIYKLEVNKNNVKHIAASEIVKVDSEIKDYIIDILGFKDLNNVKKHDIFKEYIMKKLVFSSDENTKVIYEKFSDFDTYNDTSKLLIREIENKIISDNNKFIFLRKINNSDNPVTREMIKEGASSDVPYTSFLKLVIPATELQKQCNNRPHYLDMDSILNDMKNEKQNSNCAIAIVNDKISRRQPLSNEEVKTLEINDMQKIMLKGAYRLLVRVFLHDILLRGITTFGYYDPQSLREEHLFLDFMTDLAEVEIRGMNNNNFLLMREFIFEEYTKQFPEQLNAANTETKLFNLKRIAFKAVVEDELKKVVLPKLAKRIDIDTNIELKSLTPSESTIKLKNIYSDIKNFKDFIKIENKKLYIKVKLPVRKQDGTEDNYYYLKIYEDRFASSDEMIWYQFINTTEYKFLFKYLFPVSQYLSVYTITNILATSTRKQIVDAFRDTKKSIMKISKSIRANGQTIAPDLNNPQDLEELGQNDGIWKFILEALWKTPLKIVKAFAETTEPNIAIFSTVYKIAKAFEPRIPPIVIPAASIPSATIPPPLGYLPPINILVFWLYHGLLLWNEDQETDIDRATREKYLSSLMDAMNNNGDIDCSNVINQDRYYLDNSNAPVVFNGPIADMYKTYYGEGIENGTIKSLEQLIKENNDKIKSQKSPSNKDDEDKNIIADTKNNPDGM